MIGVIGTKRAVAKIDEKEKTGEAVKLRPCDGG